MAAAAGQPAQLFQGVAKDSFGYKLLANLGWREGEGLGANKQGITEHVKVKKKFDALGVGAAEKAHLLRDWTTGMVSYDSILSRLQEVSTKPGSGSGGRRASGRTSSSSGGGGGSSSSAASDSGYDSDNESSSSSEDEAVAANVPPAAARKRARTGQLAASKPQPKAATKRAVTRNAAEQAAAAPAPVDSSSSSSSSSSDAPTSGSSSSDGSADSDAGAPAAAGAGARAPKAATHVGRYRRREASKAVRAYSATDLAAILGAGAGAGAAASVGAQAAVAAPAGRGAADAQPAARAGSRSAATTDPESSSDGAPIRPPTPPPAGEPTAARAPALVAAEGSAGEAAGAAAPAAPGWWGKLFVRGGSGVGARPAPDADAAPGGINITGFSEQDQTNLYMQAHDAATQGRKGLGRSSMPAKVAGARWAGTKTRLGSDDEGEEPQPRVQGQQQQVAAEDASAGIVVILPKAATARRNPVTEEAPLRQGAGVGVGAGRKKRRRSEAQQDAPVEAAAVPQGKKARRRAAAAIDAAAATGAAAHSPGGAPDAGAPVVPPPPSSGKPVKWKKLAAAVLAQAPKRRLKASRLCRRVLKSLGREAAAGDEELATMLAQLRKAAARFKVAGGYVRLAVQ